MTSLLPHTRFKIMFWIVSYRALRGQLRWCHRVWEDIVRDPKLRKWRVLPSMTSSCPESTTETSDVQGYGHVWQSRLISICHAHYIGIDRMLYAVGYTLFLPMSSGVIERTSKCPITNILVWRSYESLWSWGTYYPISITWCFGNNQADRTM